LDFVLHHAPSALFRTAVRGFLVRVETWIDGNDDAAAERRCAGLMRVLVPSGEALLR
jgi:hypothetical protein